MRWRESSIKMADDDSPFDTLVEAFREAKEQMVSTARTVKSDAVSPADPNAVRLTRQERLADFDLFTSDPARIESEFLRLKERYQVKDGQVPRRLVEYVRRNMQDKRKVERES